MADNNNNKKPLQQLYDALKQNNFDVPDNYNDFEATLTAHGKEGVDNRQMFYKALKDNNFDVPDNYSDFANTLFVPAEKVQHHEAPAAQAPQSSNTPEPSPAPAPSNEKPEPTAPAPSANKPTPAPVKQAAPTLAKDNEPGYFSRLMGIARNAISKGMGIPAGQSAYDAGTDLDQRLKELIAGRSNEQTGAAPMEPPTQQQGNDALKGATQNDQQPVQQQQPDPTLTKYTNDYNNYLSKGLTENQAANQVAVDMLKDGVTDDNTAAQQYVSRNIHGQKALGIADAAAQEIAKSMPDTVNDNDVAQQLAQRYYTKSMQDKLMQDAQRLGFLDANGDYTPYINDWVKPMLARQLESKYQYPEDKATAIVNQLFSKSSDAASTAKEYDPNALNDDERRLYDALMMQFDKNLAADEATGREKANQLAGEETASNLQGMFGREGHLMQGAVPMETQREYNKYADPSKAVEAVMNKLYGNGGNVALKGAAQNGSDIDRQRVGNLLLRKITDKLVQERVPKSKWGYVLSGIADSDIGQLMKAYTKTDYERYLDDLANSQYAKSLKGFTGLLASGGHEATKFLADAWEFYGAGKVGGALSGAVRKRAIKGLTRDLLNRGIKEDVAKGIADRVFSQSIGRKAGMKAAMSAASGAGTLGAQSAFSGALRQGMQNVGDVVQSQLEREANGEHVTQKQKEKEIADANAQRHSLTNIAGTALQSGLQSAGAGATFGLGSYAGSAIGKLASPYMGDITSMAAQYAGRLGTNAAAATAYDQTTAALTGQEPEASAGKSFANNLVTFGLLDLMGIHKSPMFNSLRQGKGFHPIKDLRDWKEYERSTGITDEDQERMKEAGYGGMIDTIDRLVSDRYRDGGTAVPGEWAPQHARQFSEVNKGMMDMLSDNRLPEELKRKYYMLVTGDNSKQLSPIVSTEVTQDEDGNTYLVTYNKNGNVVSDRQYRNEKAAQGAATKIGYDVDENRTEALQQAVFGKDADNVLEQAYNAAVETYKAGTGDLTLSQRKLLSLYQNRDRLANAIKAQASGEPLTEEDQQLVNAYFSIRNSLYSKDPTINGIIRDTEKAYGLGTNGLADARRGHTKKEAEELAKQSGEGIVHVGGDVYRLDHEQQAVEDYQQRLYDYLQNIQQGEATEVKEPKRLEMQEQQPGGGEGPEDPTAPDGALKGSAQNEASALKGGAQNPTETGEGAAPMEPPTQQSTDGTEATTQGSETAAEGGSAQNGAAQQPTPEADQGAGTAQSQGEGAMPSWKEKEQEAYNRGASVSEDNLQDLPQMQKEITLANERFNQAFAKSLGTFRNGLIYALDNGDDEQVDQLMQQFGDRLTPTQKAAAEGLIQAANMQQGLDASVADKTGEYIDGRREQLTPLADAQGNITPLTLQDGSTVYYKQGDLQNAYGGVIVTDENGETKQIPVNSIKEVGEVQPLQTILDNESNEYAKNLQDSYAQLAQGRAVYPGQEVNLNIGGQTVHAIAEQQNVDGSYTFRADDGSAFVLNPDELQQAVQAQSSVDTTNQLQQEKVEEAQRQQTERYTKGIKGFAEGNPDYTAKETDPKVAGEYLRAQDEQEGKKPEERLSRMQLKMNALKASAEGDAGTIEHMQNVLNIMSSSSPDYETRKKMLEDLKAKREEKLRQLRKLGELRVAYMTPEERDEETSKRINHVAEIRKKIKGELDALKGAAQNGNATLKGSAQNGQPTVKGISNEELLANFKTQNEAAEHLAKTREGIVKVYRDGPGADIARINRELNDYKEGLSELDDEEIADKLKQLATAERIEKEDLANIKAVKDQEKKLSTLYKDRNKQELDKLSPADRRHAILGSATSLDDLRKKAKEVYKGSEMASRLDELEPETLEEYISQNLQPHSINWEGKGDNATSQRGLGQETGLKRGIGKNGDSNAINYFLAPKGEGESVDDIVHHLWEDMPDVWRDRYDDRDIKNSLITMLTSAKNANEISGMTLHNRIRDVEDFEANEERQEAWYKEQADEDAKQRQRDIETYDDYLNETADELAISPEADNFLNGLYADELAEAAQHDAELEEAWSQIEQDKEHNNNNENDEGTKQGVTGGSHVDRQSERRPVHDGGSKGTQTVRAEESHKPTVEGGNDQQPEATHQSKASQVRDSSTNGSVSVPEGARDAGVSDDALKGAAQNHTDNQGNPIDGNGKLIIEKVASVNDITDEDFEVPTRNVELPKLPENVDKAIRANGKPAIIKKNIFEKNRDTHDDLTPDESRRILSATLYNPAIVGQAQPKTRPHYWVAIEDNDGKSVTVLEVNDAKNNVEIVGWNVINIKGLDKLKKQAEREDGQLLIQTADAAAAALSTLPPSSTAKIVNKTENGVTKGEKGAPENGNSQEGNYHVVNGKRVHKPFERHGDFDPITSADLEVFNEKHGDKRATLDWDNADDLNEFVPIKVDGKSTPLGLTEEIVNTPDVYGANDKPVAIYDMGAGELPTLGRFNEIADLADAYNKEKGLDEGSRDFATQTEDNPYISFGSVSGAVKFYDWMKKGGHLGEGTPQQPIDKTGDALKGAAQNGQQPIGKTDSPEKVEQERQAVNQNPTDGQKEAGNYKKGHINVDGYDVTIENPKGSTRSGKDADGKTWSIKMNYDYGYILGTKGVDGDHIDVYLSDNPTSGNVYVVDQIDQKTGKFDEHKVMYGFPSMEAAREAYASQYEKGWKVGTITEVSREDFKKWVDSSTRKTKPFAEYKSVKEAALKGSAQNGEAPKVTLKRAGDFYELYGDDAKKASEILGITLTKRQGGNYMSGFPKWALDTYLPKLLRAGVRANITDENGKVVESVRPENDALKGAAQNGQQEASAIQPHTGHEGKPSTEHSGLDGKTALDNVLDEVERRKKLTANDKKSSSKDGKSKKNSVSSQQKPKQLDLFGGTTEGQKDDSKPLNTENNDLRRTDELRTEGLQADGDEVGSAGSTGEDLPGERQEAGGADRSREEGSEGAGRSLRESDGRSAGRLPKLNTHNNHGEPGIDYAPKGVDARINANINAIKVDQAITEEGRQATPEEMSVLRKFSGWGGLGKAFKKKAHPWEDDGTAEQLRNLIGDEAYGTAEMSRNSGFFTPAYVDDRLWDIARIFGFKGGNFLEGSAGIGGIIQQMPRDMSERSHIHAVEIDRITGSILSHLYPDAEVDIQGFEKTKIRNGSIDLEITNVPFVTGLKVTDTTGDDDLARKFHDIHDFCIAKNVRKLRPGGLGIFITSSSSMDRSQKLRDWLVSDGQADVIGAFRLNNATFGGTGATSDIIVVRKRINGVKSPMAIDVSKIGVSRDAHLRIADPSKGFVDEDRPLDYNQYFIDHPENMGGKMYYQGERGDTYHPTSKALYPTADISQDARLTAWVKNLKKEYDAHKKEIEANDAQNGGAALKGSAQNPEHKVYEALGPDVKEGSMLINKNGEFCVASYGQAVPLKVNKYKVNGYTKQACFNDYVALKKAVQAVLDYQTTHDDDKGLQPLLDKLNKAYDSFTRRYGGLNKNRSLSFLKNDMDFSSIAALENYKEYNDKDGKRKVQFSKSDIFKKRVVEKESDPKPKTVPDAVITSIYKFGKLNVPYMAEALGKNPDDVKSEIINNGLGFEDPISRDTVVSYEYLSGNVREKLKQAKEQNDDGRYDTNIKALRKVIPMDIPSHLIEFTIGSSWIGPEAFQDYIKEKTDIDLKLQNVNGTWISTKVDEWQANNEKNRTFGVNSEMCDKVIWGHELILAAMQNRSIKVSKIRNIDSKHTETIVDKDATRMCGEKIDEIRDDFKDWFRQKMQSDPELAGKLEKRYNEQFNNYVPKEIPDKFVPKHFGGSNPKIDLRPHQAKAAIRATTQNVLFAHEVGSGKTFTLISTAMEMRRLGTAKKPMIVVQNATLGQFVNSAKELYPNAKILAYNKLSGQNDEQARHMFYAKIKYNDWDMIVVPQSVLDKIPDSDERQQKFIEDRIAEKEHVVETMRDNGMDDRDIHRAEKQVFKLAEERGDTLARISEKKKEKDAKKEAVRRQNAEVNAQEMLNRKVDEVDNFDDMGIDALLVDEAHNYKHLGFSTAMQRGVKGIDPSYSKKCQGLYLKAQSVMERTGGKNIVFATGTPISNTAAEIWTFMKYLLPDDTMRDYGISYFDDFVRDFGDISQIPEFNTAGNFVQNNRFKGYQNLPELVRIWSGCADTVLSSDIEDLYKKLPRTIEDEKYEKEHGIKPEGDKGKGRATDVYLPQTKALRSVMKYVRKRLEDWNNLSGKEKREQSAVPIVMYGIAKAAAVDPRLVMKDAPDDPMSKTNQCVDLVMKQLDETKDVQGAVAIFADNYQRKPSGDDDPGFNLYDDIKAKLIKRGVPEYKIVIFKGGMSNEKKTVILDKLNSGEVRVALGSTFSLGTGTNFQERLGMIVNLDAPNRPMDYWQRVGRILRQGNLFNEWGRPIKIIRFGVEDSLDVTAYQRLKTKGAIADSIMHGKKLMENSMDNRTIEEEEDQFGDVVAQLSGSQYAILKQNAERELRKYIGKQKQWQADQVYVHSRIPWLEHEIAYDEERVAGYEKALEKVEGAKDKKTITIGKQHYDGLDNMSDFVKDWNKKVTADEKKVRVSTVPDMKITHNLKVSVGGIDFNITLDLVKAYDYGKGALFSEVNRNMVYSCPALGIKPVKVSGKGSPLRNALDEIVNDIMTGYLFRSRIDFAKESIAQEEKTLEQVKSREGKPFEYADQLAKAREQVEDYTAKMQKELEEKQKKYAELDSQVEEAKGVEAADEDVDDDEKARRQHNGDSDALKDAAQNGTDEEDVRYRTSEELNKEYGSRWLDEQTNEDGRHTTQVKNTIHSYEKFGEWVKKDSEGKNVSVLDASSGLGLGTQWMRENGINADDVEPYPSENREQPTYTSYDDINKKYDYIISNAVLNVIPDDWRAALLHNMADKLKVGGKMVINVRGAQSIAHQGKEGETRVTLDSPSEILVKRPNGSIKAYQKGFTKDELKNWCQKELGDDYSVEIANKNNAGGSYDTAVVVTKNKEIKPLTREAVSFKDGEKLPIQIDGNGTNWGTKLHVDGLSNDYDDAAELLDAFRNKFPDYVSFFVDADGKKVDPYNILSWGPNRIGEARQILNRGSKYSIQVEPWSKYLKHDALKGAAQNELKAFVEREQRRAQEAVDYWTKKLNIEDDVQVLMDNKGLTGKKAKAKGWFDPKTGKITIILGNHKSIEDVVQTILHEAVGHYGLRKLFGTHFDAFLDNVCNNVSGEIYDRILDKADKLTAGKKDLTDEEALKAQREATEEYLSGLAEDTNFEDAMHQGWWGKIKDFFLNMLARVGIRLKKLLSDNELRYILWRSYMNPKEPGTRRTPADEVVDDGVQEALKVGNYQDDALKGTEQNEKAAETRFRLGEAPVERTEEETERMKEAATDMGETLGGVPITFEKADESNVGTKGWYEPKDNSVHVVAGNHADRADVEATVCHEVLGHEGLKALFGSNAGVNKFGQYIYENAGKELRRKIVAKAAEEGYSWDDPLRYSKAAQEVFADIASQGPATDDEFNLWRKAKHYVIGAFKALNIKIPGLLNDHDLRYYVLKTGKAVKTWAGMSDADKQALAEPGERMMRRGKPRKKKNESMAQFIQRLREWEMWNIAEQKAKEANDPMPEKKDFEDKAQAAFNKAMDEWRLKNNIQPGDEEPDVFPRRKDGESPQDYAIRVADYETTVDKWKEAPDIFEFEKKAMDEWRTAYEAWKQRYDIHEMESVDEQLYSGIGDDALKGAAQNEQPSEGDIEVDDATDRELSDAVGVDTTPEGAQRQAKLAVIERRKNLESSSADDAIFIHDLCKDIDAVGKELGLKKGELRSRLINIIEAPVQKKEAEKEVGRWVDILNKMRTFQDAHSFITVDGVKAAYPELKALEHLIFEYGEKPRTAEQRDEMHNAAVALANKLNDYYKETTGYHQLFGDDIMSVSKYILKMGLAADDMERASALAEEPKVQELVGKIHEWYDNFYHAIEDAGLRGDAGYIPEGYINHIWDKDKSDKEAWNKYIENYQRTKSANMRHRDVPTYSDGIQLGLVPKFDDVAKIMSYYSRQNNEAIANKKFLDDLSFLTISEKNEDGEVTRTLPVMNSHHPNRFDEERYKMYHVPGVGDVWVLKEVSRRFASIFGTMRTQDAAGWLSNIGKGYDMAGSVMKKIQLGFSGFHMGALTEVALAQMRPDRGMKAIFKYILLDSIRNNGEIPAYAHPEDFKFAASHLVQLGATQDYAAADVNMITQKFRNFVNGLAKDDNFMKKVTGKALNPFAVMLDWINRGTDKVLWNYLHDGLKIACFKYYADQIDKKVAKEHLTEQQRDKLLDEAGQYTNDTFGGQYWELLNVSPATLKWLRRAFLSPDWLLSTQRHFFSNFGFGSLYDPRGFVEYVKESFRLGKAKDGALKGAAQNAADVDDNIYRKFRSKEARLCYLLGVCGFFYTIMNGLNAVMRAKDEEKEKEKAEEERKTNPEYKSPYELAYPEGMKWYDYTMLGNSLGQQTHLFMGRYKDGTEMYVRWGKQFREFPEMFIGRKGLDFPAPMIQRMMGKANPVIGLVRDNLGALGIWGFDNSSDIEDIQAKYGKTIGVLAMNARHFIPFSVPTQADKEFKMIDLFMPSSKGFTQYKTIDYFKDFIKAGDIEGVKRTYKAAMMNGIDVEKCLNAAITTLQAEQRDELRDGISDLTGAFDAYNNAKTLSEKKAIKVKLIKYLAAQNYKAYTRDEALQTVQDYLNGTGEEASKDNDKYIMQTTAEDIRDDYKLNALDKQAKTYVDALKDAAQNGDAATAAKLAKRYGAWIEIHQLVGQERREAGKLKKMLGKGDDAGVMKEIRKLRKETQKQIDAIDPPK